MTSHRSSTTGRLAGRRVLLTGASSGVGAAAVALFAAEGARLAILARSADALEQVASEHAPDALVLAVDVTDRDAVEEAVEEVVRQLGGLDVLVSNAAAAAFGHFLEVHPDDFDRTVDVTFTGAANVVRAALPHLRDSRGAIVATLSLNSRLPLPTWSAYAAAKHGLRGLLNTVRLEEREQGSGVDVSLLHPGPIDTPLFGSASSATSRKPRVPPDAYRPEVVARALVEMAISPRDEVVLGGETRMLDLLFAFARPVAETTLLLVDRWYRSGDEPAQRPGTLYVATPEARIGGGIPSRDSLLAPLQLGRRLIPSPATPFRLARHLASAGKRAVQLSGDLLGAVAEEPPPAVGLATTGDGTPPRERGQVKV